MEQALSVSQLNQYIRMKLEQDDILQQVCVAGELSNVTMHRSGHIYLKLKDEKSVISGVIFRFNADKLEFVPKEGQRVIVYGNISVYEPSGSYQIKISVMQLDGLGALYAAFESRKKELDRAGLFDPAHKKQLPKFPQKIGVITSPTGAAIRDIIRVCGRRYPSAEIILYPSLVQGEDAAQSLVKAVEWFDSRKAADVLIIGRGGGSIEDLWCFNDEALAYAIYNCDIPTVSAVGHEIDFTISDFVADVRAATPSMAAELICPDMREYLDRINEYRKFLTDMLQTKYQTLSARLNACCNSVFFRDPSRILERFYLAYDQNCETLHNDIDAYLQNIGHRFEKNVVKLDALSPLATLARGYATVQADGKIISDFSGVDIGDQIDVNLKNKSVQCTVNKIKENL